MKSYPGNLMQIRNIGVSCQIIPVIARPRRALKDHQFAEQKAEGSDFGTHFTCYTGTDNLLAQRYAKTQDTASNNCIVFEPFRHRHWE